MKTSGDSTTRRRFLQTTAGTLTAHLVAQSSPAPAAVATGQSPITDTNVSLGQWPIRHLPLAEPAALAAKLKSHNVMEAWAGSLDALLHKDLASVNARTAETCAKHPIFKPVGAVNPALPRWQDDIERCAMQHRMRAIRIHPNYHGYKLDDPRFVELLILAASQKIVVQIACAMEDERTQHPLLRVPPVDLSPLPKALAAVPDAKVMLLKWPRVAGGKSTLALLKNLPVLFDIADVEGIMGIETLLEELPVNRIVFGSYAPVFYFESAKLKLQESALDEKQMNAITHENAARFIAA